MDKQYTVPIGQYYDISWLYDDNEVYLRETNGNVASLYDMPLDINKYLTACILYNVDPHYDIVKYIDM